MAELQRLFNDGRIAAADFVSRRDQLLQQEEGGRESPTFPIRNLIEKIRELAPRDPSVAELRLSSVPVWHCGTTVADRGWGCGYRNTQMLLSALREDERIRTAVFGQGCAPDLPSVPRIQRLIEAGWTKGFDVAGAAQLGNQLHGTHRWIGATEVAVLLRQYRVRYRLFFYVVKIFRMSRQ